MSEPSYRLVDVGDERVLTVDGREFRTHYSERVVRMLIARKGARRARLYFPFKKERGEHFLGPLFRYLDTKGVTGLSALEVRLLSNEETRRLPWPDGAFDLVLVVGIVEHLSRRYRREQVDEYYRVLAPGGHIAILDTPNRWFPYETHSVGLPFVQWLPPRLAYGYARAFRPRMY